LPNQLAKLFEPGKIGSMQVRNRIVHPCMSMRFVDTAGAVTQRAIDYYAERARGGVGLVIVDTSTVGSLSTQPGIQRIDSDHYIRGLNEIVKAVHLWGAKIGIQLTHVGTLVPPRYIGGMTPVSASRNPVPGTTGIHSRALSINEIKDIQNQYAEAARRAKTADFDTIEIQAAHGHLIGQFLSRHTNRRKDRYGGDLNRRFRFAEEIIDQVRARVGSSFPLMARISAEEFEKNGITLDEAKETAKKLEETGVDCVDVSLGITSENQLYLAPMAISRGHYVYLAEAVKKCIGIPVVTSCRINDPRLAESILEEGKADFVAIGRGLATDPELPNKAREGRFDEIRMCMACNDGCVTVTRMGKHYACTLNAAVGNERDCQIRKAEKSKRVVVVGGGPGGLEAARVAALRGHEVFLLEKNNQLGGQMVLGAVPPHTEEVKNTIRYFTNEMRRLGVKVTLNVEATPAAIHELKPQVVVLATGAEALIPEIKGVHAENVITAWDVLRGANVNGQKIAMVGGGLVGCEVAELLAGKGKSVTVVEMLPEIAGDMNVVSRKYLLERFDKNGVQVLTDAKVQEITPERVIWVDKKGSKHDLQADAAILAVGAVANERLSKNLAGAIPEMHIIGDSRSPRTIRDAVHEGFHCANHI